MLEEEVEDVEDVDDVDDVLLEVVEEEQTKIHCAQPLSSGLVS